MEVGTLFQVDTSAVWLVLGNKRCSGSLGSVASHNTLPRRLLQQMFLAYPVDKNANPLAHPTHSPMQLKATRAILLICLGT